MSVVSSDGFANSECGLTADALPISPSCFATAVTDRIDLMHSIHRDT